MRFPFGSRIDTGNPVIVEVLFGLNFCFFFGRSQTLDFPGHYHKGVDTKVICVSLSQERKETTSRWEWEGH